MSYDPPAPSGQANADNSQPVVIASDQSAIPVTLPNVSTATKQSDGSQKTQIVDPGGEAVTVSGGKLDVNASVDTATLATNAKQDIGNSTLSAIKTDADALAGAVSGSEMQVDVVAPIPAGTAGLNTIGKVAPNDYELAGNTTHINKYYTNAGAVTDGTVWSPAVGKRWYVTDLIITVSANCTITLEDDLTGGDSAVFKAELAANSGISHSFNTPLFSSEDGADLIITTTAGNVYVTITGYEI